MPASTPSTRPSNPTMSPVFKVTVLIEADERLAEIFAQLEDVDFDNLKPEDRKRIGHLFEQIAVAQAAVDKPLSEAKAGRVPDQADVTKAMAAVTAAETDLSGILTRLDALEADMGAVKSKIEELPNIFADNAWVEEQFTGAKNYIDDTRTIALEARAMASISGGSKLPIFAGLGVFILVTLMAWGVNAFDGTVHPLLWALVWGGFAGAIIGLILSLIGGFKAKASARARVNNEQVEDEVEARANHADATATAQTPANTGTHA